MHEKLIIISGYVCNRLFSIGEEWPEFASYLEDINNLKESFFPSTDYLCTKNA